jgi:hypothetical protein
MKSFSKFLKEHCFLLEDLDKHTLHVWSLFGYRPDRIDDKKLSGHAEHVRTAMRVATSLVGTEAIGKQLQEIGTRTKGNKDPITFSGENHRVVIGHPSRKAKTSVDLQISDKSGKSISIDIGSGQKIIGTTQEKSWGQGLGTRDFFALSRASGETPVFSRVGKKTLPVREIETPDRNALHQHINDSHEEHLVLTPKGHVFSARTSSDSEGNYGSSYSFRGSPLRTVGDHVRRARYDDRSKRRGVSLYLDTQNIKGPPDVDLNDSDHVSEFVSSMLEKH